MVNLSKLTTGQTVYFNWGAVTLPESGIIAGLFGIDRTPFHYLVFWSDDTSGYYSAEELSTARKIAA